MKKVLIITYYWPPAGGPGVQRWLKFAKYLPEFQVEPHIYTPENPNFPLIDKSLEKEVQPDWKVIKQPIWEPYQLAQRITKKTQDHSAGFYEEAKNQSLGSKVSLFIRGNFFIPDARRFWIRPSVRFLKKYITENQIDTVISSGPPHSMHLIALGLKKEFPNLNWIADFRDPWTNIYYYKSLKLTSWADKKHHQLELEVLNSADAIITVTDDYKENYQALTTQPVYCLTNGFDPEDQLSDIELDKKFSIAYIGAMFKERNPYVLWDVLAELCNENQSFKEDLLIKFIGKFDNSVTEAIAQNHLQQNVEDKGYLPHEQAVIEQHRSQVLLMVNTDHPEKKGNIPGKIFEYIGAQRPVIAFGPADSQIEKILVESHAGKHFLFTDKVALKQYIKELYHQYKQGNLSVKTQKLEQYNRKNITENLVRLL